MKPTQVGEWWWCEIDGWDDRRVAVRTRPERKEGEGLIFLVPGGTQYWLVNDPAVTWLGPVAAFADPAAIDAPAEARLAAGWVLQYTYGGTRFVIGRDDGGVDLPPAPLPAGGWRLAEGPSKTQMWVRWVVAP